MSIKKFNELFDTADQYADNEIPYLTGDLKDDIIKSISNGELNDFKGDPEMVKVIKKLYFNFPFFNSSITRVVNHDSIIYVFANEENLENAFYIKIDKSKNDLYSLSYGEVVDGVEHSDDIRDLDYSGLYNSIEKTVYPKLIELSKFLKDNRDIDILHADPKTVNFNPMFNSKIYTFKQYVNESNKY